MNKFRTILIGGESARKAAFRIGEFDYLCGLPFSIKGFVNPNTSQNFTLVNSGEKWFDLPIFKSLDEVFAAGSDPAQGAQGPTLSGDVNSIGIHFNAKHVLYWVQEVVKFPKIKNVVILAEDVPERDAREICHLQSVTGINILGPSSLGMIIPGRGRIGEMGGDWNNLNLCRLNKPGPVGLITKSGGMSGELMWVISQNTPGLSGVFQIGGDTFPATDFVHWLEYFSRDKQTKVVVLAGEAGGDLEERAASWYKNYLAGPVIASEAKQSLSRLPRRYAPRNDKFKLIAVISGKFLEKMPKGQKFGHAGAKQEESGYGSAAHKVKVLREAGVEVVEFEELGRRLHEKFA